MSVGASSSASIANISVTERDKDSLWYFTAEQLANSPSRRYGIDSDQELSYRQMTAYLIQEMGQRLQVSQLCINTAIVYMHRFYAFHSFTHFHRNGIAAASLFLAAKVEEQPRKLEHVIKAANKCLNQPTSSTTDAYYIEQAQDLVFNENVLLQTLGFDVAIDHPHTHVVKTCHLVKACKDLAQTSYFLASNSLHLTSMCLQYKPTVVACFCIYLACKWSRWEIPQSTEGKHWFHYVDKTVTMDLLKQLTDEFIAIYEKSPARLKSKLNSIKALAQGASNRSVNKDKKMPTDEWKMVDMMKMYHSSISTTETGNISNVQSGSFSSQAPSDQQMQSLPPTLLPPPQPQLRKSELHSSQHRTHHNSSSHQNTKVGFTSGDISDHKLSHKQLFGSGNTINRIRDHPQTSQPLISSTSARGNISSSSGRTPLPNSVTAQISQRQTTQGQIDANYHKSRERCNLSVPPTHGMPPHVAHKLSQKQETSGRSISKESNKMMDLSKQAGGKIFSSSSTLSLPQFGSHQLSIGSNSISKNDPNSDIRNSFHNQRTHVANNIPPFGYHQSHLPRQCSGNNNKHDQPKSLSVHMQQQQHHKPSIPIESAYVSTTHEPQQILQHLHPPGYLNMRSAEAVQPEDHSNMNSQFNSNEILTQTQGQTQVKMNTSMFSPEWNDKIQNSTVGSYNGILSNVPGESLCSKAASNIRDSPQKVERDRTFDMPIKKEKNRNSHLGLDVVINVARYSGQQQLKPHIQKHLDSSSIVNELAGTSMSMCAGIKRHNENIIFKQENDLGRESKMRRLDNISSISYSESKNVSDLSKLHVVNGIETNPDLVRSLLKEGLCTTSGLIKTEPLITPSIYPPAELLEPSVLVAVGKASKDETESEHPSKDVNELIGSKTEKKKKKDKHKHKEKDKLKDRDERKKHKKDKDRHKERDRDSDNSEHVKIKISKEKLDVSSGFGEPIGFKIKIPKDRITGDINSSSSSSGNGNGIAQNNNIGTAPSTSALKIKISKDKLENYSSGSTELSGVSQLPTSAPNPAKLYPTFGFQSTVSSATHSSKKKDRDRDRDREKDKKRGSHDFMKSNGGTSGASGAGGSDLLSTAMSKNTNSNKF